MKKSQPKYGQWALVTGASAGIGLEFSKQLAAQEYNVFLVSRDELRLKKAKSEIEISYDIKVEILALDLLSDGAAEKLNEATINLDLGLAVLNAGMEASGNYTRIPLEQHRNLHHLNTAVPMEMAHLFGERFIERKRGGIIFLSSLFGYQGVPLVSAYSASKAYILTLGEALNVEFKRFGVDVLVLSPGLTDTDMPANMPINFSKMPIPMMSTKRAVRIGLKALGRKASVVPGFINKFYAWENRFLPRITPTKLFGLLIRMAFKKERMRDHLITEVKKAA